MTKLPTKLTFVGNPFHQQVELLHADLLLALHHPGEADTQRRRNSPRVIGHTPLQLLGGHVPNQGSELRNLCEKPGAHVTGEPHNATAGPMQ